MTNSHANSKLDPTTIWTGMVPVEDTALAVTDTRGPGRPVVYLNGSYATQMNWRHVTAELGNGYRHITYDERARGRSMPIPSSSRPRSSMSRRASPTGSTN